MHKISQGKYTNIQAICIKKKVYYLTFSLIFTKWLITSKLPFMKNLSLKDIIETKNRKIGYLNISLILI